MKTEIADVTKMEEKTMDLYMDLNKSAIEKSISLANKRAIERDGNDGDDNLLFAECDFRVDEGPAFNEAIDSIDVSGEVFYGEENLGYMSLNLKMDFEDIISLIETYRKRLGKLKTVLEATKD